MGWFSDQIKKRKENNQIMLENSFNDLAGIKNLVEGEEKDLRDIFICSQLTKYFEFNSVEVPNTITGTMKRIDYVTRSGGVAYKKITIARGWNIENRDPILVFTKRTNTPVLLLPTGSSDFYYISYHTGKKRLITNTLIKVFKGEAYVFYNPLPNSKLTLDQYVRHFKKTIRTIDIISVITISVIATVIGMLPAYIIKRLTGEVVENKDFRLFAVVSFYVIGAGLIYILIKATQAFINARVAIKMEKTMQQTTMMRMLSLPPSFFKKYDTGELTSRFMSVSSLSNLMFNGIFLTALSSLMSLVYFTQVVQFAPSLVWPVLAIITLTSIFSIMVSLIEVKVSRKQLKLSAKESGVTYSLINGIQKIRLAGAEKRAFSKWAQSYAASSELLYHPPLIIRLSTVISMLISLGGTLLIYLVAAKNSIDISSYMAFTTSFASLSVASSSLSRVGSFMARLRPAFEMTRPLLEEEVEDSSKESVEELKGDIVLENVSFKYSDKGPYILEDINLHVKNGEYLGIVGKTGCGKSTIVRLLLGFEKVTLGKVLFDGKNIQDIDLQSLRRKIGSVTQNGGIFHADILSNILITSPDLGEKEAWEAAEIAGIAEDIRHMPMGMSTVISEGQGGISGGQKQRIMIARAIVNKPKVLIFDEATSALDNRTQNNISEAINKLNCTRIVIAHRLSTIKNCDRIIYIENGKIEEEGNYQELIDKRGKFFELVERQKID